MSNSSISQHILTEAEVELLTGVSSDKPLAQYNFLRRQKINCHMNKQQRVIVTWHWVNNSSQLKDSDDFESKQARKLHEPNFAAVRKYAAR